MKAVGFAGGIVEEVSGLLESCWTFGCLLALQWCGGCHKKLAVF